MEACGSAHYWARQCQALGLEVKLISPQFVVPFRKSQKNDRNDAEAICEAARRPNMRFVGVKSAEQLQVQALHRVRERGIRDRTAVMNQVRGLLLEHGIAIRHGRKAFEEAVRAQLSSDSSLLKLLLQELWDEFWQIDGRLQKLDKQVQALARASEECRKISRIVGVGPTIATAILSISPHWRAYRNGRGFAASLGLTPRQFSTGGVTRLGSITKCGDSYLRKLLVQGAKAAVTALRRRAASATPDKLSLWVEQLYRRCGANRTAVALANKIARHIWAILAGKRPFEEPQAVAA